jgi:ABC-type nitrate/sulfonate/bicarbonate transport system permease component
MKTNLRIALSALFGAAVLIAFWWFMTLFLEPVRLPSPWVVLRQFINSPFNYPQVAMLGGGNRGFGPHLWYTLRTYLIGTSLGIALGVVAGILVAWSPVVDRLLTFPVDILRTVPSLAALPFLLIWFGPGSGSQAALVILYTLPMILVSTVYAIRNVSPIFGKYASTLGASRSAIFRTVMLPAMLPELMGGIRVALAVSWGLVVVAEFMGSPYGVGKLLMLFIPLLHTPGIFVGIIWILIFATITDLVFVLLSRPLLRWIPKER